MSEAFIDRSDFARGVPRAASPGINLHLYTSALRNDSRFLKQAQSVLRAGLADEVILLGRTDKAEPLSEVIGQGIRLARFRCQLSFLPKFKLFGCLKYVEFVLREAMFSRKMSPTTIHCHSVSSLPAGVLARFLTRRPMVYDARELETESNGLRGVKQTFVRMVERSLIRFCDAVLCVSDSIADWYAREYRIPRPFVVRNISDADAGSPTPKTDVLRQRLRIPASEPIFIYSGALTVGRRVEQMIRVFKAVGLDRHLVFMGFGPLESLVKEASEHCPNIHFLPAVAPSEVVGYAAGADVGIVGVENNCLSYHLSLPNKLFEYLMAGIPFLAPDYPEMRRMVESHQCGWVVGEQENDWKSAILGLDARQMEEKAALVEVARKSFSWQTEEKQLLGAYRQAAARTGMPPFSKV